MAGIVADPTISLKQAFDGNHLLSTLPEDARAFIESVGTVVHLQRGAVVLTSGSDVTSSLFPFGPTMISMAVELSGGRSVEVALIGRRGAVGGIISCGQAPAFTRAMALVAGPALSVPMKDLEEAKHRSPFVGNLFCRFSDYLLSQVMQSVACNAFHSIPQRAARWLLHAQDRTGNRIQLTQQALAGLLGVQRTTVNAVVQTLEKEALISTGRGVVHVVDRESLMARSCECYQRLEEHFAAVIGDTGTGSGG